MVKDTIEREITIDAPVQRVWSLITEPEHLGTWFADAGADVDLRPGGEIRLRWAEYGETRARIETLEPPHRLTFRWAPFKEPGGADPVEGNSTLVEFTLSPAGDDATRLHVLESGFTALYTSDEQRARNHGSNTEGWRAELGELAEYAARQHA